MKKVLFYNKGYETTGKSASIKAVFWNLKGRVSEDCIKEIPYKEQKGDVCYIVKYRGVKIGIESQGDPNSELVSHVNLFLNENCDIIVCACRTKGKDFDGVFDIIRENGYAEFACPHFCVKELPDDAYPQLNGEYACQVVRWIDWWIDNYYQQ